MEWGVAKPKRILIVDDHAALRMALRHLIDSVLEFEVCGEAENGREGIERAGELQPDLIILDLSMPVMNGFEAARELKALLPSVPRFHLAIGEQTPHLSVVSYYHTCGMILPHA